MIGYEAFEDKSFNLIECGNGLPNKFNSTEACDDGNTQLNDGCSQTC